MDAEPRYSYHYSPKYGGLTLRMRIGEYVEEIFMQDEEAEQLHRYLERLRTDKKIRMTIEQYFNN